MISMRLYKVLKPASFLNWNLPHGTFRSARATSLSAPSPMSISTPSDIIVETPPANASSPNNAPSSLTRVQSMKQRVDRANMFVTGQYNALVKSMNPEEKTYSSPITCQTLKNFSNLPKCRIMSKWLNQFWLFGFKTAKFWGRGPRHWTAHSLRLDLSQTISPAPVPDTPKSDTDEIVSQRILDSVPKPSSLCRWSIHYRPEVDWESNRSRTPSPDPDPDPADETTWKPWPSSWSEPLYQERLLNSLESNDFSNIKAERLPVAVPHMIKALQKSNHNAPEEALGFSIMAQNVKLLDELLCNLRKSGDEVGWDKYRTINPVHLATTFMSGSKVCCQIVDTILFESFEQNTGLRFRLGNKNSLGHTVFDNLMLAILKAHTSTLPGMVDESLRDEKRFPGEEVDICGRWDADSDCIRALVNAGIPTIPSTWKHKFCHTSIQAITHCIDELKIYDITIDDSDFSKIQSGLFKRLCVSCGRQLQMYPLHTLVLTGFGLAQFGHKDEDLFGLVAVLLSMLSVGMDPRLSADISILALFPDENSSMIGCGHRELTPAQLASGVPDHFVKAWSTSVQVGWSLFCHILRIMEIEWNTNDLPFCGKGHKHFSERLCYFGVQRDLATLWAAIQTELLTYRRLKEGDPWISPHFDMRTVLENLNHQTPISVELLANGMMNPLQECGCLSNLSDKIFLPRREDVASYHFSNLEDWSRTTFLGDNDPL